MSKLERLMGRPKEYKIGEIDLLIHPLTLDNIDLMMSAGNPEKQADAIREIITLTLKKSVPDSTEGEIKNFGMEHFETLFNAIAEVNHLGGKDVSLSPTDKIKEFIKQRQNRP